jgi:3-oxoacyl-[acyl-carrier protein] reductase
MASQRPGNALKGKVAVVVGGATGFGLATSKRFAAEGAHVVVAGRRGDLAQEVAGEFGGTGVACDITDFHQLNEVTDAIVADHGGIDVGVNYAGFEKSTMVRDLTPEILEPMVNVQFNGAVYFIRAMGNAMAASGGGSIISTSSLTAQNPSSGHAAYAGAKKGLEYVTQIAAVEYGGEGVRVNAIAAHLIETPMTEHIFQRPLLIEAVKNQTPMGFMGHVDDIANCALFLASEQSRYISGETIRVDGAAHTQKLPTQLDYELLATARPDLV